MPDQSVQHGELRVIHHAPPLRVVLAALPPVYAHGLRAVLQADGSECTVLAAAAQLTPLLVERSPLVVVVPEAEAAGLLQAAVGPAGPVVVVLLAPATPEACAQTLRAGATGILTPDDAPDDALLVLRGASQGRTVLPHGLVRTMCRPTSAQPPTLTPTELGWLRRLAAGGTVSGLARSCGYSEREMYRRLSTVYLRLGARTRTEALLLAERYGLLDTRV